MSYQILALDLDGTLTNSKKEITKPTLDALIEIQKAGKKVVLASGRPTNGVLPLAEQQITAAIFCLLREVVLRIAAARK